MADRSEFLGTRTSHAVLVNVCSAWLSPEGYWYHAGDAGHYDAALIILRDVYGIECDADYTADAVEMLEARGWVHISYGGIMYAGRSVSGPAESAIIQAIAFLVTRGITDRRHMRFVQECSYHGIGN